MPDKLAMKAALDLAPIGKSTDNFSGNAWRLRRGRMLFQAQFLYSALHGADTDS
jgi:hypothetical protein